MMIQPFPLRTQAVAPDAPVSGRVPVRAPVGAPAQTTPSQASEPTRPTPEEVKSAVSMINQALQKASRNLEFSIDTDANKPVVKLVDKSTGELIRQFPSEAALAISRDLEQVDQGLLIKQKA